MRSALVNVDPVMIGNYFTEEFRQARAAHIFFRGLILYTLVKVLFVWQSSAVLIESHNLPTPGSLAGKILLLPTMLAGVNIHAFYFAAIVLLVLGLLLKPFYVVRVLFFYLTFNLYVINLPMANGSDIVLFMLGFWSILMGRFPSIAIQGKTDFQKMFFNMGLVLCQLQIVNVYLVSGLDKLFSETWQSGVAFAYISHLDFYYNPVLPDMFENTTMNFILSWCTILFELLFVVLVWTKRARLPILAVGVLFNLFIWIVLSIPDFAFLMIVSFLIFLKDEDYQKLTKRVRPSLP